MSDRRNFVKLSLLSTAGILAGGSISAQQQMPQEKRYRTTKGKPIVLSTWDFGKPANAEAWKVLRKDGRALDAVEAGVKVPEADPNNQSVGYGDRKSVV